MPNTHPTNVASSSTHKTLGGPHFFDIILPMRWFDRLIKGMFQYELAFFNDINLLSIASMVSSKFLVLQFPLGPVNCLITLANIFRGCDSG
jgi:hypothetical protein